MSFTRLATAYERDRRSFWRGVLLLGDSLFDQLSFDGFYFATRDQRAPLADPEATTADQQHAAAIPMVSFSKVECVSAEDIFGADAEGRLNVFTRHRVSKLDGTPDYRFANNFFAQSRRCVLRFTGVQSIQRTVYLATQASEIDVIDRLRSMLTVANSASIDQIFAEAMFLIKTPEQAMAELFDGRGLRTRRLERIEAREHRLRRNSARQLGFAEHEYLSVSISAMPTVVQDQLRLLWNERSELQGHWKISAAQASASAWNDLREHVRDVALSSTQADATMPAQRDSLLAQAVDLGCD